MRILIKAHQIIGVRFDGMPEYIDYHSYLDPSGGLFLGRNCVVSTNVIVLTHDWSFLRKMKAKKQAYSEDMEYKAYKSVSIGEDTFVGAGSIILPGTTIGKCCIVGAGAVVKGRFEDYSVIVGAPARKIKDLRD